MFDNCVLGKMSNISEKNLKHKLVKCCEIQFLNCFIYELVKDFTIIYKLPKNIFLRFKIRVKTISKLLIKYRFLSAFKQIQNILSIISFFELIFNLINI